jgi:hypothetical protein
MIRGLRSTVLPDISAVLTIRPGKKRATNQKQSAGSIGNQIEDEFAAFPENAAINKAPGSWHR